MMPARTPVILKNLLTPDIPDDISATDLVCDRIPRISHTLVPCFNTLVPWI